MKFTKPLPLSAIALPVLCALLTACSSPSQIDEIVASNLSARGGKERIQALQSIRETGTVTASDGRVARVVREIKRPGLFRLEFSSQGTTSVFAHDGDTGWQVAPLQGQFEPQKMEAGRDAAAGVDQRDIEGPLVGWREKGRTVELVGREELPGGDTFKLEVTLEDGAVRYDYVDVASRQIVRSDVPRTIRGHAVMLENTFSDFRDVDGLVFPFHIETHVVDRPEILTITVDSIELNPDLEDEQFRFPG
jgi:outer membrane lipoprotein-sorting protein